MDEAMDVDSSRRATLGFCPQKELIYNRLLPYAETLDAEAKEYLDRIKGSVARSLLLSDCRSLYWIWDLAKYVRLYGRLFSKEDHVYFVQVLLDVVTVPDLELNKVATYASVLTLLLKKRALLTPEDLQIEWRPLFDLYDRTLYSSLEQQGLLLIPEAYETTIKGLVRVCRNYFRPEATQEILDQVRSYLCLFDGQSMQKGTLYLELFLPTLIQPKDVDMGFSLWFNELMTLWEGNLNTPKWEQNLVSLFSRLARDSIASVDWTPWIPKIFTHLLCSFNLMGGQHKVQIQRNYQLFDIEPVVHWLVSMLGGKKPLAMDHLEMLFKALDSYYYPSNIGKWDAKLSQLLYKLPAAFARRLHRERHKKPTWDCPALPESHRISDETVTRFVNTLQPVLCLSMFSRFRSAGAAFAFQDLAALRPEIVIPPLLDQLYSSLETVTEPHRLTSTLQCAVAVARSLTDSGKYYPEGPSHVIPLLHAALPGVDPNDLRKCMVTFQFISTFSSLIPIIDCSAATEMRSDLSETEYNLCLSTSQLEDFVLNLMDKCFGLIENSASEHRPERGDDDGVRFNPEENIIEVGLTSAFHNILTQCSTPIFNTALDKLHRFVCSRIFEPKVAGKLAANMCMACVRANPKPAVEKFVPHFCKLVLTLTESEEVMNEEKLDEELLFRLLLLSEVVHCGGRHLLLYKDILVQALERTLHLTSRQGYSSASLLLRHTMRTLTSVHCLDFRSISPTWEEYGDFNRYLPVRDWGKPGDINNLNVKWHIPSDEELKFATDLLDKFLLGELNFLTDWVEGKREVTREALKRSLTIVCDTLSGAAVALPLWEGENIPMIDTQVPLNTWRVKEIGVRPVYFGDGSNVRQTIAVRLRKVLKHILSTCEDDTKSLKLVIRIYHLLMFDWGLSRQDCDTRFKSFRFVKKALENKLVGMKKHIRSLLVNRISLQHELRVSNKNLTEFTEMHRDLMADILGLSVSHYTEVRIRAQETLNTCFRFHPYAYRLLVPQVIQYLSKDLEASHEEFKGALFVILGKKGKCMLTVSDWSTLTTIWLALVNSRHSEKPSINLLLERLNASVQKYFDTISLTFTLPEKVQIVAGQAWSGSAGIIPSVPCPSEKDVANGLAVCKAVNDSNLNMYSSLVKGLVESIDGGALHWRHRQMAFVLLSSLIRYDIALPAEAVATLTKNLANEDIEVRKICVSALSSILKQQKRSYPKKILAMDGKDNHWLQFQPGVDYQDEKVWRETTFVGKPFLGFYSWPKNGLQVYEKEELQPKVNRTREELSEEEKPIFDFFVDKENVDRLMSFLSLEEKKGKDKFNAKRFNMFRGLFRNFGPTFLVHLKPILEKWVNDSQETHQRCCAEIITGLVRGSKCWPHNESQEVRLFLTPLIKQMLVQMTAETYVDWGTCCATCFENQDARRVSWFVDLVLDDPLNSVPNNSIAEVDGNLMKATSFLQSSRIYCLLGVIQQQEWRSLNLLNNLLDYLKRDNHLTQAYQNVRERLGILLTNIFLYDVNVPCLPKTLSLAPNRSAFIDSLLPQFEPLLKPKSADGSGLNGDVDGVVAEVSPERKAAANLLKTICKWMVSSFSRNACSAPPETFKLLPIFCEMQSESNDEELMSETLMGIILMSHSMLSQESIEAALKTCNQVIISTSWHSRSSVATFLQYMVFTNLFIIRNNARWVEEVKEMIVNLLADERVEVRESASETLAGLLHCEFIQIDGNLIQRFKKKVSQKLKRVENPNNSKTTIVDPIDLVERHAGILGLCAAVNAYPYDVPQFMPQLLLLLGEHLNDPQPISGTVKKTLSNFKRTHHDSWRDHKKKFTDDQLALLTDLLVSPSYYA